MYHQDQGVFPSVKWRKYEASPYIFKKSNRSLELHIHSKCLERSLAHGKRREGRTKLATRAVATPFYEAGRLHVPAARVLRIPLARGFLSAPAASAARIPGTPIGPQPGRALGRARELIGRPRSMKRPRRFLRRSAALVCGEPERLGWPAGRVAPAQAPAPAASPRPPRDLSRPAPPAPLSRVTAGVGGRGPRVLCWLLRSRYSVPSQTGPSLARQHGERGPAPRPARTPPAREQVTRTEAGGRAGKPRRALRPPAGNAREALVPSVLGRRWGPATATPPTPPPNPDPRRPGATRCQRRPRAGGLLASAGLGRGGPLRAAARGENESGSDPRPPSLSPSHNPRSGHARISA